MPSFIKNAIKTGGRKIKIVILLQFHFSRLRVHNENLIKFMDAVTVECP